MCGRFTRKENFQQLAKQLGLKVLPPLPIRYNLAPSQVVAGVRTNPETNVRELTEWKWGFIPSWAKDPRIGNTMINARAETVAGKPAFRRAFRSQRCVVLADGFYEWKREGKAKQPYYIRFKDHRPFVFAGLWDRWEANAGQSIQTCVIITTEPNSITAPLHDRMPAILNPQNYDLWLDPNIQDAQQLIAVLHQYPSEDMEAFPIDSYVNSPQNDSPLCLLSM